MFRNIAIPSTLKARSYISPQFKLKPGIETHILKSSNHEKKYSQTSRLEQQATGFGCACNDGRSALRPHV
jgi:hypothetical protein